MTPEQLNLAARTVVDLAAFLAELKSQAIAIYEPQTIVARGYITPAEELALRHLQLSYWKARCALFELMSEIWADARDMTRATPAQFLIALAAASVLVDAARFLRESFHRPDVVRRKLDEPDPVYGIPARMYDDIQKSLTSPHHAWHLWQATRYYDGHRGQLLDAAATDGLLPLVEIIDGLRDRLRPSLWTYVRTRARVRGRRTIRHFHRDVLGRATYGLQEAVGRGMAEIRMRPGHAPSLPREIRAAVVEILRPGDVLVVRKEFAITNYFLPGHWPHVALYLGTAGDLAGAGIATHPNVVSRLHQLSAADATTAVLTPNESQAWQSGAEHPCVLESMKDGVRIRSVNSPFNSDSIVVIRPLIDREHVAAALAQALMHEGKPYDFDFDFCASHRLVCTEVVYRGYDGVGGVQFNLGRHAGRFALAAGDILRMALARNYFEVLAAYSRPHSSELQFAAVAHDLVNSIEGNVPGRNDRAI